jgi:dGTPase
VTVDGFHTGPGIVRAAAEARERRILAPGAALAGEARRLVEEEPCPFRTAFQRDRDRIIHSKAFRRLAYKTQVFAHPAGDHFRTRLTHTLEVSQIARTLANALNLNEDLTEAIALGHDLGHTPFGHAGEKVLNRLHPGGFTHQAQSLRVVDHLAKAPGGLNLTLEVRDGILKHSKGQGPIFARNGDDPATLEGQLVRVSDIIAYLAHDLDDAIRAGLLRPEELPPKFLAAFGPRSSTRIGAMVGDLLAASRTDAGRTTLAFSPAMEKNMLDLRDFLHRRVYRHLKIADSLARANLIIEELYLAFSANPEMLTKYYPAAPADIPPAQAACDFVASMTDRYAQALHQSIFPAGVDPGPKAADLEIQTF